MTASINDIHFQLTDICNRSCPYCFGAPPVHEPLVPFEQLTKILQRLQGYGLKNVSISGGEPLLYEKIDELLDFLGRTNINIYMSTNCDFYTTHRNSILSNVKSLAIPIDGSCNEIHNKTRGLGSFDNVLNTLQDVYEHSNIKLTIGTVYNIHNYKDLENIYKLLVPYYKKIRIWKIYEMINYSRNTQNCITIKPNLPFPNVQFENSKLNFKFYSTTERDGNYFLINPCGNVMVPTKKEEIFEEILIGNLFREDLQSIIDKWGEIADLNAYYNRYLNTEE